MSKVKKNKMQDYRGMDIKVLSGEVEKLQISIQEFYGQIAIGKLTNHTVIKKARREIARIKTVQQEKIILQSLNNE